MARGTLVKLGDVVQQTKDTVKPREVGLRRIVAGQHMESDYLNVRTWGEIKDDYLGPAFHMRFRPGHVLYGSRRTYLRKVAQVDFEGVCSNTTFVLEPRDPASLLPDFLLYVLSTESFHQHSQRQSKGSVNPYVNFSDLGWYEFLLPPAHEQRRLLAALGAARRLHEDLSVLRDTTILSLYSLRDDAYTRASAAAKHVYLSQLVRPSRPICYGILMPGTGLEEGVPVVKVKDYPSGTIDASDLLLTSPEIDEEFRRSRLSTGDLLVSIRGTIGRIADVPERLNGANITQDSARVSLRDGVDRPFVRAMLESLEVQRRMYSNIPPPAVPGKPRPSAEPRPSIQGLNIGALRKISIPLPSSEFQEEIGSACTNLRGAIDAASRRVDEARALRDHVIDNLVGGAT